METRKSTINLHNSSISNTLDLVDRISNLPDSILGLILSYLPTKNAVATSILSKRWKFLWLTVHNLDFFCGWNHDNEIEISKFVEFVNHVLLLLDGGLLNKFSLVWDPTYIPFQVSKWINTAITRNVRDLFVSVRAYEGLFDMPIEAYIHLEYGYHEALEMPISLFSYDSLQSLELKGNIYVSNTIAVCLPRLETLKLVTVNFQSKEAFEKLICGCPLLNYLQLHTMNLIGLETYIISSTSLKRLDVLITYPECLHPPNLQLKASSLEYFKLGGRFCQVNVQGCLSSLVEADFRIQYWQDQFSEDIYNSVVKAVHAFDCAKALTLSMDVMWAFSNATISLCTKFSRLVKLKAQVLCCYCNLLLDFIQSTDSLEVLTIDKFDEVEYNHDHSNLTAPVDVPKCLSNSLKEVSYEGFTGCDDEHEMIDYLLKHGSALEVMQITCPKYNFKGNKTEFVKGIFTLPRKSPVCKVEFME